MKTILEIVLDWLPTAVLGLCLWLLQRKIDRAAKKKDEAEKERMAAEKAAEKKRQEAERKREQLKEQQELFLVKGVNAALAVCEATAKAVQRIPDAHCNGDMHKALDYADKVKHDHKDFLIEQGIIQIFED